MDTFSQAFGEWLRLQAEAAQLDTADATERAAEALQALREHPAARHARRTHAPQVRGAIDGMDLD